VVRLVLPPLFVLLPACHAAFRVLAALDSPGAGGHVAGLVQPGASCRDGAKRCSCDHQGFNKHGVTSSEIFR